jgi:hypothetical protein
MRYSLITLGLVSISALAAVLPARNPKPLSDSLQIYALERRDNSASRKGYTAQHGRNLSRHGPGMTKLELFETTGQGCPPGTTSQFTSEDFSSMTVMFDKLVAIAGPGVPDYQSNLKCKLQIKLGNLSGRQWAVVSNVYRGAIFLEEGVTATRAANYEFIGEPEKSHGASSFSGPIDQTFELIDDISDISKAWSPCDRDGTLIINMDIAINSQQNPQGRGRMNFDSADQNVTHTLNLNWRDC